MAQAESAKRLLRGVTSPLICCMWPPDRE